MQLLLLLYQKLNCLDFQPDYLPKSFVGRSRLQRAHLFDFQRLKMIF